MPFRINVNRFSVLLFNNSCKVSCDRLLRKTRGMMRAERLVDLGQLFVNTMKNLVQLVSKVMSLNSIIWFSD